MAQIVEEKIDYIVKAAEIRSLTRGQNVLVDYDWSVKMVPGSDVLRNDVMHLVVFEFLLMNGNEEHERRVVEFSQDEFAKFHQKIQTVVASL